MSETQFKITFLRHGESTGNADGVIQGQADLPLTPRGQQQAQRLARLWAQQNIRFDQVICSPLKRARETAEIVAAALNTPIQFDPIWMERSFGSLEGLSGDEIHLLQPNYIFQHPYQKPGGTGESTFDLHQRASQAVQQIMRRTPGRYLIVSHGAILNMALYAVMGLSPLNFFTGPRFQFGNTGYTELSYQPETRMWRFLNFINPGFDLDGES